MSKTNGGFFVIGRKNHWKEKRKDGLRLGEAGVLGAGGTGAVGDAGEPLHCRRGRSGGAERIGQDPAALGGGKVENHACRLYLAVEDEFHDIFWTLNEARFD